MSVANTERRELEERSRRVRPRRAARPEPDLQAAIGEGEFRRDDWRAQESRHKKANRARPLSTARAQAKNRETPDPNALDNSVGEWYHN